MIERPPFGSASTRHALALLGQLIRVGRRERKLSAADLAARVGISRSMLHRIEAGDPTCGIGAVFEAAAIAGVPLLAEDARDLDRAAMAAEHRLALLPRSVRAPRRSVTDDF